MAISINSNTAALKTIGKLNSQSDALSRTFERLSSGQRINRASDDPAGLSVASALNAKARVLTRGRANASDGLSLMNIAGGALAEVNSILTRMGELAGLASNDTLSKSQRSTLEREYNQLTLEIRRIAKQTKFNGISLLGEGDMEISQVDLKANGQSGAVSADGRYFTYQNGGGERVIEDRLTNQVVSLGVFTISGTIQFDAAGDKLVFVSASNINGENPLLRQQVWSYNRLTQELTRVTDSQGAEVINIRFSSDGSSILFSSRTRYNSNGGATSYEANRRYNIVNLDTQSLSELAVDMNIADDFSAARISADGSYVAIESRANINGLNPLTRDQYFVFKASDPLGSIKMIGDEETRNSAITAGISNEGRFLYLGTGSPTVNPGGIAQIWSFDHSSGVLSQLTNNTVALASTATNPVMSSDGSRIAFLSNENFFGQGGAFTGTRQIYVFDTLDNSIKRVTSTSLTLQANATVNLDFSKAIGRLGSDIYLYDLTPSSDDISFSLGSGAAGVINAKLEGLVGAISGMSAFSLSSVSSARGALAAIQDSLVTISNIEGGVGASISRLESAERGAASQSLETQTASSRITDIDVAVEISRVVKLSILRESSVAILAQANQIPEIALRLLGVASTERQSKQQKS